jgi:hypothetical protein
MVANKLGSVYQELKTGILPEWQRRKNRCQLTKWTCSKINNFSPRCEWFIMPRIWQKRRENLIVGSKTCFDRARVPIWRRSRLLHPVLINHFVLPFDCWVAETGSAIGFWSATVTCRSRNVLISQAVLPPAPDIIKQLMSDREKNDEVIKVTASFRVHFGDDHENL